MRRAPFLIGLLLSAIEMVLAIASSYHDALRVIAGVVSVLTFALLIILRAKECGMRPILLAFILLIASVWPIVFIRSPYHVHFVYAALSVWMACVLGLLAAPSRMAAKAGSDERTLSV